MKIIVTGAAGFIGSNLIRALNGRGISKIIAVDNLKDGDKFRNLVDLDIQDYFDAGDFYPKFFNGGFADYDCVFHQGACSDTMESDGQYMMQNNFSLTRELFEVCIAQSIQFIYASSAATYGLSSTFREEPEFEKPLNVYGYSKLLVDNYIRKRIGSTFSTAKSQVAGLRYFNVYGPREQHKGRMASVAYHQYTQHENSGFVKLFRGTDGIGDGEQRRDFIYVDDVVKVNLWLMDNPGISGLFNVGSGSAQTFNELSIAVLSTIWSHQKRKPLTLDEAIQTQALKYIDFPEALKGKYQSFTEADLTRLRSAGYTERFLTVEEGVALYAESVLN